MTDPQAPEPQTTDVQGTDVQATADRLQRRRARILFLFPILFIIQQGSFLGNDAARPVDVVKISAWLVTSIMLLIVFATGGSLLRSREVRALMNDETTRAHRNRAAMIGFFTVMATGILLYGLSIVKLFSGRDAVHVMITVGIASACIAFATAERRALA